MKPITRLKKELKQAESLLFDVNQCIENGWKFYLGDPIYSHRREIYREVIRIKSDIQKINQQ